MALGVREPGGVPHQHQDPGPDRAGCLHSRGAAGKWQHGFAAGCQSPRCGWMACACSGGVATETVFIDRGEEKVVFEEQLFSVKWLFLKGNGDN